MPETVVVLGASPDRSRYGNRAVRALLDHGHTVIPVYPKPVTVHGLDAVNTLKPQQVVPKDFQTRLRNRERKAGVRSRHAVAVVGELGVFMIHKIQDHVAVYTFDWLFPCRIYIHEEYLVCQIEALCKSLSEIPGSGKQMRLEDHGNLLSRKLLFRCTYALS